jgi:16S rRNA (guanine527-N7)-methyltransferase
VTHAELGAAGFDVSEAAYRRLAQFVDLLLAENQKFNLTAIREPESVWISHVCDSLAALPILQHKPAARILDLGAGGGVPGIPLACVLTDAHFTLLDATRKKVDAAGRIAAVLDLANVRTIWGRAEALARDNALRGSFDFVLARAVAKIEELLRWAAPFMKAGGRALLFKTRASVAAEMETAQATARRCGLRMHSVNSYHLAGFAERVIAVYERN